MPKAFLSYSSAQKSIVKSIADQLGTTRCFIDSKSFEEGMDTLEEIMKHLDVTDLFVLFLSDEALKSPWVEKEILKAKDNFDNDIIKRIYPIIIDNKINYKDPRIPEWLRKEKNIQTILRPGKIYRLIIKRLREISWEKHPDLRERDLIFVGRNGDVDSIEKRIDDIEQPAPYCLIAAGLPRIGRRTVLKKGLKKANIILDDSHELPIITMDSRESIEDFIYKLYDLGFNNDDESLYENLMAKDPETKVELVLKLIKDIQDANEILIIEDKGGIISHDRKISEWFFTVLHRMSYYKYPRSITFCIASKYNILPQILINNDLIFQIAIPVLPIQERIGLFQRLCKQTSIVLDKDDMTFFTDILNGFPEQINYAVELIKSVGTFEAKKKKDLIVNFQNERTGIYLKEFMDDINMQELLIF